jgi:hypothetical protein
MKIQIGSWVIEADDSSGILALSVEHESGEKVVDVEDVSFGNEMAFHFTVSDV